MKIRGDSLLSASRAMEMVGETVSAGGKIHNVQISLRVSGFWIRPIGVRATQIVVATSFYEQDASGISERSNQEVERERSRF